MDVVLQRVSIVPECIEYHAPLVELMGPEYRRFGLIIGAC
jgi:hypothetical protein